MFELFTERARRVIFFARYEASETGCRAIGTEHLLLGLMRENRYLLPELPPEVNLATMRVELFGETPAELVPKTVDMPLSESAQRVLQKAAHERYSLRHDLIMSGHLLLGVLDDEQSSACALLKRYGVQREYVIPRIPDSTREQEPPGPSLGLDIFR